MRRRARRRSTSSPPRWTACSCWACRPTGACSRRACAIRMFRAGEALIPFLAQHGDEMRVQMEQEERALAIECGLAAHLRRRARRRPAAGLRLRAAAAPAPSRPGVRAAGARAPRRRAGSAGGRRDAAHHAAGGRLRCRSTTAAGMSRPGAVDLVSTTLRSSRAAAPAAQPRPTNCARLSTARSSRCRPSPAPPWRAATPCWCSNP